MQPETRLLLLRLLLVSFALAAFTGCIGTPLMDAARRGDAPAVNDIINDGANVNEIDRQTGAGALHWATDAGQADIVRILLEKGANPLTRTSSRYYSVNAGEVNTRFNGGTTPLHLAAYHGFVDIARMLLDKGGDVNAIEQKNWTPLHFASSRGQLKVVKLLLEKGADVNYSGTGEANTPLHLATSRGDREISRLLIDNNADVSLKTSHNVTALMFASATGMTDIMQTLIKKGADVNAVSNGNENALHWAAGRGQTEAVRMLLENGVDAGLKNRNQKNPYRLALEKKHNAAASLIKEFDSKKRTAPRQTPEAASPAVSQPVNNARPIKFNYAHNNNPKDRRDWTLLNALTYVESQSSGMVRAFRIVGPGIADNQKGTVVRRMPDEKVEYFIPDIGSNTMWVSYRELPTNEWTYLSAMQGIEGPVMQAPPVIYQPEERQRPGKDYREQAPASGRGFEEDDREGQRQARKQTCVARCEAEADSCNSGCAGGAATDVVLGLFFGGGARGGLGKAAKGGTQCALTCASKKSACIENCE